MRDAVKLAALYGLSCGVGFVVMAAAFIDGCYATTGPKPPTCAQDPRQPWCPPPIHDERPPK